MRALGLLLTVSGDSADIYCFFSESTIGMVYANVLPLPVGDTISLIIV